MNIIHKKEDCCGCTACKSICPTNAIKMKVDNEGFLYPNIDDTKCIECGLCKKVCRFQNGIKNINECLSVYAVKHKEHDVRMKSTSGGAFTAISDYFLKQNGFIYGAAFDENMKVCHQFSDTKSGVNKFRGSKYVQSDLGDSFTNIEKMLRDEKKVLFTGTPCQIDGLTSYLKTKKINMKHLITCDIVCHGVPSPLMFEEYIRFSENKNKSKIVNYYCRDKSNGWHSHTEKAIYENGKEDNKSSLSIVYRELFYAHTILRPSCHKCIYANTNRQSDITIGDYWGIEKIFPEFDDNKGVSLLLINTEKGEVLFENINDDLIYIKSNIEECLQPQLQYPSEPSHRREEFWDEYRKNGFEYIIKKYARYNLKLRTKHKLIIMLKELDIFDTIYSIVKKYKKLKI